MTYQPCPECDADVVDGTEHREGCRYEYHDAESLFDRRRSWDRQAAIDRRGAF